MVVSRLFAAVLAVSVLTACPAPTTGAPAVTGRTWQPVDNVEAHGGRLPPLTVQAPGDHLVVEVAYDACHWAEPRLAGTAADRLEVRLTELSRFCVLPIPRLAVFHLDWTEVPNPVTLVDQNGAETIVQDRRVVP